MASRRRSASAVDDAARKDAAWLSVIERYGEVLTDALSALNHANPRDDRAFERVVHSIGDEREFNRRVAEWLSPYRDARIGAAQRVAGAKSKGIRRETYAGKAIHPADSIVAAVREAHEKHPTWSFNRVCTRVAKQFDYRSAWSVKRAAAAIKWPDPRRSR